MRFEYWLGTGNCHLVRKKHYVLAFASLVTAAVLLTVASSAQYRAVFHGYAAVFPEIGRGVRLPAGDHDLRVVAQALANCAGKPVRIPRRMLHMRLVTVAPCDVDYDLVSEFLALYSITVSPVEVGGGFVVLSFEPRFSVFRQKSGRMKIEIQPPIRTFRRRPIFLARES